MTEDIEDKYAFPHMHRETEYLDNGTAQHQDTFVSGVTIRDYFAAKGMAVLLSDFLKKEDEGDTNHISKMAYRMADSMLKERAK